MFEYLEGLVVYKKPEYIAMDIAGIGYRVYISLRNYEEIESNASYRMYIYNHIKEEEYRLIGFLEEKERKMFELLLSVKGIGVSLALAALSTYTIEQIVSMILEENVAQLKRIPKLGEKKAQQIILDIRSKVKSFGVETLANEKSTAFSWEEDIASALENLGYARKEITSLLEGAELQQYASLEEAMRAVLKKMK